MAKITTFGPQTSRRVLDLLSRDKVSKGVGVERPPERGQQPFIFFNNSGFTVPPFGCMKVQTIADVPDDPNNPLSTYNVLQPIHIVRPNGTGGPFLFNSDYEIPDQEFGEYQTGSVVRARVQFISGGDGSGEVGSFSGPIKDSFECTSINQTIGSAKNHDAAITVFGQIYQEIDNYYIIVGSPIPTSIMPRMVKVGATGVPARSGTAPAPYEAFSVRYDGTELILQNDSTTTPRTTIFYNWVRDQVSGNGVDNYVWTQPDCYGRWYATAADCSDKL